MAILVLLDHDNTHTDPVKDERGCYKRGDIVAVHEDSAHNGDLVANPVMAPWLLVKITGVTKAQIERLMVPHTVEEVVDGRTVQRVVRRRRYRVMADDVPLGIRNELRDNRYVEVTWAQVKSYIQNKIDQTVEP